MPTNECFMINILVRNRIAMNKLPIGTDLLKACGKTYPSNISHGHRKQQPNLVSSHVQLVWAQCYTKRSRSQFVLSFILFFYFFTQALKIENASPPRADRNSATISTPVRRSTPVTWKLAKSCGRLSSLTLIQPNSSGGASPELFGMLFSPSQLLCSDCSDILGPVTDVTLLRIGNV